jgi:hypothetical protein
LSGGPDFSAAERRLVARLRTPALVQRWLRGLSYNWEPDGETCFSFRVVVRTRRAHCLEGALAAACILEQHGHAPLLVSLASRDLLDHVLFVFRSRGRWGSVGRSRDLGLHGRKAVFRSVRDLVWSYFDPYIDATGRIVGYGLVDLRAFGSYDWRLSERNVWKVERALQDAQHVPLRGSDARWRRWHARYLAFRAEHPHESPTHFPGRAHWLL